MSMTLERYEQLCSQLLQTGCREANNFLVSFHKDSANVPTLQGVMGCSSNPDAMVIACGGLQSLFETHANTISDDIKKDTKNFILNFVFERAAFLNDKRGGAVIRKYIRLYCLIVKQQWLDGPLFQDVVETVQKAMATNDLYWLVGLQIFADLVEVMQPEAENLSRSRRIATSFRDLALKDIFQVVYDLLQSIASGQKPVTEQNSEAVMLLQQLLRVAATTMQFDFMGTLPDDSSDEVSTVMLPSNWSLMRDPNLAPTMRKLYIISCQLKQQQCASYCLQFMVSLAALRRSFFPTDQERNQLVGQLIEFSTEVLQTRAGMQWGSCYHEVCKLLSKLNTSSRLRELLEVPAFTAWMDAVFNFTTEALQPGKWCENPQSKHYLMLWWASLVSPLSHITDMPVDGLKDALLNVGVAFVEGQLRLVQAFGENDPSVEEDPIGDETTRTSTLEVLVSLSKHKLLPIASLVGREFEASATLLTQNASQLDDEQRGGAFARLTWLMYAISALIGGHSGDLTVLETADSVQHSDQTQSVKLSTHVILAKLISPVLLLIQTVDQASPDATSPAPPATDSYELAVVFFLEKLRAVHLSEQDQNSGRMAGRMTSYLDSLGLSPPSRSLPDPEASAAVPTKMSQLLGLPQGVTLLDMIVRKLILNLSRASTTEVLGQASLLTLTNLCSGVSVMSFRSTGWFSMNQDLMVKTDSVLDLIQQHRSSDLLFLMNPKYSKFRTRYYRALSKLLFSIVKTTNDEDKTKFSVFMQPLTDDANRLLRNQVSSQEEARGLIVRLFRDLRGIVESAVTSDQYSLVFDWLVDRPTDFEACKISLVHKAIDLYWHDAGVCVPLLKFMAEVAANKGSGRIQFPANSMNGLILFKAVVHCLLTFGRNSLTRTDFTDAYREKYKPTAVAVEMFCNAEQGEYVNAGVFAFYGDSALTDAISTGLQLVLQIPPQTLAAYAQSLRSVFLFLQLVAKHHCGQFFSQLPEQALLTLLATLSEGFLSFDPNTRTQACSALASVVSFCWNQSRPPHPSDPVKSSSELKAQEAALKFLNGHHQALRKVLFMLVEIALFETSHSNWSLSRPLLPLILLFPDEWEGIRTNLVARHPQHAGDVSEAFNELMQNIKSDLSDKNRDQFTSQLYMFTSALKTKVSQ